MAGYGGAYRERRGVIGDLVRALPDATVSAQVPACPAWTVKDLLAHLVAICTDTQAGRIDGVGSEEWTDRQISERRDRSIDQLLQEWDGAAPGFEEMMESVHPAIAGGIIGDLVTHELDLRGAIDSPGGTDSEAFELALDSHVRFFGRRVKQAELPALEVRSGERVWTAGAGDPIGKLEGEAFEILRSLTGRRTLDQVEGLAWSVDPKPYLAVVSMYGLPEKPLSE
jgi:uncharacterized protein (TIGR03083 family)